MLDRQSLLSGNTALTGGLGHWWWWVWVFLITQYSSFTLQILKWLDTAVWGGGGTGGSSTWVTLLGNITLYSSCGMGGPNFENPNFSKSRYENFDEIASKYIYIYSICTILYDQKWNVAGAETKSCLSLGASWFWASYTVGDQVDTKWAQNLDWTEPTRFSIWDQNVMSIASHLIFHGLEAENLSWLIVETLGRWDRLCCFWVNNCSFKCQKTWLKIICK